MARLGSVLAYFALLVTVDCPGCPDTVEGAGTVGLAPAGPSSSGVSCIVPHARESCLTATVCKIKRIYDPSPFYPRWTHLLTLTG